LDDFVLVVDVDHAKFEADGFVAYCVVDEFEKMLLVFCFSCIIRCKLRMVVSCGGGVAMEEIIVD